MENIYIDVYIIESKHRIYSSDPVHHTPCVTLFEVSLMVMVRVGHSVLIDKTRK